MTLLRKYYSPGIEGGGIPDEMRIEKAYQLLVKKSKEAYLSSGSFSASPFGLDGIPHVRRDAISKLMVEFSDSELSLASEELAEKIKSEPVNFLLVNALRHLTTEQIKTLADSLYERIPVEMRQEELASLKEENERLRGALSELYDVVYKGENVFKSLDKAHEVLNKPNITIVQSTPSPTKK